MSKNKILGEEIHVEEPALENVTESINSEKAASASNFPGKGENTEDGEVYDVFGKDEEHTIHYKTMSWLKCGIVMIAETIALGILSLPSVNQTIGMVPGVLITFGLGVIATYTGYNLGLFRLHHPQVSNMADAGDILWGRFGKYLLGSGQIIFLVFIAGSHGLTGAIAMATLTNNSGCAIVWSLATCIVCFLFTLPRTLDRISYLSFISSASILTSVFITIVGTGVESAPYGAPKNPNIIVQATTTTSFFNAFLSVTVSLSFIVVCFAKIRM